MPSFLIILLEDAASAVRAAAKMKELGLHNIFRLEEYGLHMYYNIKTLVQKVPLSAAGNPWSLAENTESVYDYNKGACPQSDALFERSILIPIPSRLTEEQEQFAADAIREAVTHSCLSLRESSPRPRSESGATPIARTKVAPQNTAEK